MASKTVPKSTPKESPKTEGYTLEDRVSLVRHNLQNDVKRLDAIYELMEILENDESKDLSGVAGGISSIIRVVARDIDMVERYLGGENVYEGKEGGAK